MKWLQLAEGDRSKGMLLASEMGSDQEADCIRSLQMFENCSCRVWLDLAVNT